MSVSEQKYPEFSQFNIKHHHSSVVDTTEKFKSQFCCHGL